MRAQPDAVADSGPDAIAHTEPDACAYRRPDAGPDRWPYTEVRQYGRLWVVREPSCSRL